LRLDVQNFERSLRDVDALLGADSPLHGWFFADNPFARSARAEHERAEQSFFADDVPAWLVGDTRTWLSRRSNGERSGLLRRWRRLPRLLGPGPAGAAPGRVLHA
jgi:hypothetical protein